MGDNSYQARLRSLEVLDRYAIYLKGESDFFSGYPMKLKIIHESFSDSDDWNDIRHTEFFEDQLEEIILEASKIRIKMDEAIERLYYLKEIYSNAGFK